MLAARFPFRKPSPAAAPKLPQTASPVFPPFPGTKDIHFHPLFKGSLSKWMWKFYTHRLTRAGRWFSALTAFLIFGASPSLDVQAYIPLLYAGAFWFITIVAVLFNRPRVTITSHHSGRISAGETLPITVDVTQASHLPAFEVNVLPARLPPALDAQAGDGVPVGSLKPGETRRVSVGLVCRKRGVYTLKGFRVESDFPFGLLNAYREYRTQSSLLVYPAFTPLARLDMPVGRRHHPGGVAFVSHLGDSFEFLGNREYREGENIRDIDWRATARMGGNPVVREYREEYFLRVGVVLDTFVPQERGTPKADREKQRAAFERAISVCAALGDTMAAQEYMIDIFAVGPKLYHLTAGRSLAYLDQILDILACVESTSAEPLPEIAPEIHENLEQITSVVCVFLRWDEVRQAFVDSLRERGAGVKVVLVLPEGDEANIVQATGPDFVVVDAGTFADGITVL